MNTVRISMLGRRRHRRQMGFTMIELVAVVAIIVVLLSLILPAIQQVREAARRSQCKNNLAQIGIALNNYTMAHGMLPPGTQNEAGPILSKEGAGYHMGWLTQILPYIEQANAYHQIDFTQSAYDPANLPIRQHHIPLLNCPSNWGAVTQTQITNYCGVHNDVEAPIDVDQNGVLFLNSSIQFDQIQDGCSNTLFVVETRTDMGSSLGWMSGTRSSLRNLVLPINGSSLGPSGVTNAGYSTRDEYQLHATARGDHSTAQLRMEIADFEAGREFVGGSGSVHFGGAYYLMGDGAVRFISENISPNLLRLLANRADGDLRGDF